MAGGTQSRWFVAVHLKEGMLLRCIYTNVTLRLLQQVNHIRDLTIHIYIYICFSIRVSTFLIESTLKRGIPEYNNIT